MGLFTREDPAGGTPDPLADARTNVFCLSLIADCSEKPISG